MCTHKIYLYDDEIGKELMDNCVYNVSATADTTYATTEENREWSPRHIIKS